MDRSTPIYLVAEEYTTDALGQRLPSETQRMVFANVRSVTRSEWNAAGQQGIKPEWQMTMFAPDYEGEKIVIYNGKRFAIYRTYLRADERLELYVEEQVGVTSAQEADDGDEDDEA